MNREQIEELVGLEQPENLGAAKAALSIMLNNWDALVEFHGIWPSEYLTKSVEIQRLASVALSEAFDLRIKEINDRLDDMNAKSLEAPQ